MADFITAFYFWIIYEVLSWPLRLALAPMAMRGDLKRMISRLAGPPIIVFTAWVFGHLFVPVYRVTIWLWVLAFMAGAYWLCHRQNHKPNWAGVLSPVPPGRRWGQNLAIEVTGLLVFFAYLAFRRWTPDMTFLVENSGAEKFGNASIFWSSWHAHQLPPDDYWLLGQKQAYYYWGHFFWAWIGRASFLPGEWIITLALARAVSLTWEGSYLLVRSFGARPIASACGALLIAWGSNPKSIEAMKPQYDYHSRRGYEPEDQRGFFLKPKYLKEAWKADWDFRGYDFWAASRVIENSVNEFPAWSMLLGDFHAHHLSNSWLVAWIAVVVAGQRWFRLRRTSKKADANASPESPRPPPKGYYHRFGFWLACFLVLGTIASISNLWVGPLVGAGSFGLFLWRGRFDARGIAMRAAPIALLAIFMVGGALLTRGSMDSPLPPEAAAAGEEASFFSKLPLKTLPSDIRSTKTELFLMWGFQVIALGAALFIGSIARKLNFAALVWLGGGAAILFLKFWKFPDEPGLYWIALAAALASLACGRRPWFSRGAAFFVCSGCLVLAGLEWFFIPDRFRGGPLMRYNTYFKICYPVWSILGAGAWIGAMRLWKLKRFGTIAFDRWVTEAPLYYSIRLALLMLVPPMFTLVALGTPYRILGAHVGDTKPRKPTLDGFSYVHLRDKYVPDAQLLDWIKENVPPGELVVEAAYYAQYSYNGRIGSLAGRPAPLGWAHHEEQWRGEAAREPTRIAMEKTAAIYEAKTPEAAREAAKAIGARWVVFGLSEREHYGTPDLRRADAIYKNLRQAGRVRAMFPSVNPQSFIFQMDADPDLPAGESAPATRWQ